MTEQDLFKLLGKMSVSWLFLSWGLTFALTLSQVGCRSTSVPSSRIPTFEHIFGRDSRSIQLHGLHPNSKALVRINAQDTMIVVDNENSEVYLFSNNGDLLSKSPSGLFSSPVDAAGSSGMYVADMGKNRLMQLTHSNLDVDKSISFGGLGIYLNGLATPSDGSLYAAVIPALTGPSGDEELYYIDAKGVIQRRMHPISKLVKTLKLQVVSSLDLASTYSGGLIFTEPTRIGYSSLPTPSSPIAEYGQQPTDYVAPKEYPFPGPSDAEHIMSILDGWTRTVRAISLPKKKTLVVYRNGWQSRFILQFYDATGTLQNPQYESHLEPVGCSQDGKIYLTPSLTVSKDGTLTLVAMSLEDQRISKTHD